MRHKSRLHIHTHTRNTYNTRYKAHARWIHYHQILLYHSLYPMPGGHRELGEMWAITITAHTKSFNTNCTRIYRRIAEHGPTHIYYTGLCCICFVQHIDGVCRSSCWTCDIRFLSSCCCCCVHWRKVQTRIYLLIVTHPQLSPEPHTRTNIHAHANGNFVGFGGAERR